MTDTPIGGKFAHPKLPEKVDKLFELNIGELVDLPQAIPLHQHLSSFLVDRDQASCCGRSVQYRRRGTLYLFLNYP